MVIDGWWLVAGDWWLVVQRKSTYDIGPGDQAGFYILYFMFVVRE